MKQLRKIIALFLVLALSVSLLTGCGGKKDSADSDPAESNADISTSGKKHAGTAEDPYPLTDALLKYRIWYDTGTTFAKDSKVKNVYVFDNDMVRRYSMNDLGVTYTLGDFSRMTDEEIVAALESAYQTYAENISAQLTPVIQELETMLNGDFFSGDYIVEIDMTEAMAYGYGTDLLLLLLDKFSELYQSNALDVFLGQQLEQFYNDYQNGALPKLVLHCDFSDLKSEAESLYETYKDYLERLFKNQGAKGFDRAVFTDSSGNAVLFETIRISYETFSCNTSSSSNENGPAVSYTNFLGILQKFELTDITSFDSDAMVANAKVTANLDDIKTGSISISERKSGYDVYNLGYWMFNTIYESTYNCYYYSDGLLSARADEMFYITPDSMDASGILVDPTDW